MPRKSISIEDRFLARLEQSRKGPNDCWLWGKSVDRGGYGIIWECGDVRRYQKAHRVSWRVHFGEIPNGLFVCHSCDTPGCINPAHLFLGTNKENILDAAAKGRIAHGDRGGSSRLTSKQVEQIRLSSKTNAALAREIGVSSGTVSLARRGVTWRRSLDGSRHAS